MNDQTGQPDKLPPRPADDLDFVRVWEKYQGQIRAICFGAMRSSGPDGEELFAEVRLRMLRGWPSFRHGSEVMTWATRIVLNTANSMLVKRKRRWERERPFSDFTADAQPQGGFGPSTRDKKNEHPPMKGVIESALQMQEISEKEAAVELAWLKHDGKPWDQIAELENTPTDDWPVIHHRVRPKLRGILFAHYPGLLGGIDAVERAYQTVRTGPGANLSEAEASVFEAVVFKKTAGKSATMRSTAFRSACGKVIEALSPRRLRSADGIPKSSGDM